MVQLGIRSGNKIYYPILVCKVKYYIYSHLLIGIKYNDIISHVFLFSMINISLSFFLKKKLMIHPKPYKELKYEHQTMRIIL